MIHPLNSCHVFWLLYTLFFNSFSKGFLMAFLTIWLNAWTQKWLWRKKRSGSLFITQAHVHLNFFHGPQSSLVFAPARQKQHCNALSILHNFQNGPIRFEMSSLRPSSQCPSWKIEAKTLNSVLFLSPI